MKLKRNMKNVDEGEAGSDKFTISVGQHEFIISEIQELYTKNGDPMFNIKLICNKGDKDAGKWCFDKIVIPEENSSAIKIMGRSKHFLHCIGEPYDNDGLDIDSDRWLNKKVVAETEIEAPNEYHPKFPVTKITNYVLVEGLNSIPDASMEQSASPIEEPF
jgi:hypothetical protein